MHLYRVIKVEFLVDTTWFRDYARCAADADETDTVARSGRRKPHRRLPLCSGCSDGDDEEEEGTLIFALTPGRHLLLPLLGFP